MSVYRVPPHDWRAFCRRYSHQHRGESVTVERLEAPGKEPEVLVRRRPLRDVALDEAGRLRVEVGEELVTLEEPTRITFEQHGETAPAQVDIEAGRGRLRLLFAQPAVPGILDRA